MTDSDRARRTALTADVWETVRTAREAPAPGKRRPGRRRRWLLLAVAVAAVGAGSLAVPDLFSTPPTQQTKRAKPRRAAHRPAATATRPKTTVHSRVPAVRTHEKPRPTRQPQVRSHIRRHVPNRKPAARPKRTVHTHAPVARTHVSPRPIQKPRVQPHDRPNVPSTPVHAKPKTFAWLKVAGAAGYRVAFFKPGGPILFRDTKAPQLTVPGTWRYRGKRETLSPGRYRWYVWPLDAGGRPSTRAIVNSALVIGR